MTGVTRQELSPDEDTFGKNLKSCYLNIKKNVYNTLVSTCLFAYTLMVDKNMFFRRKKTFERPVIDLFTCQPRLKMLMTRSTKFEHPVNFDDIAECKNILVFLSLPGWVTIQDSEYVRLAFLANPNWVRLIRVAS